MKRISNHIVTILAVSILTAALLLGSCSSTSNLAGSSTVSRGKFVGTWTLNNVDYQGLVAGSVQTVFDQAPPAAFVGSTWKLTNSGNGIYTLGNGTSQTIFWSVNNNAGNSQLFQFKKLYQGDKARKVEDGYQLVIAGNDGSNMTLKSPVSIGNQTGYVVYSFAKN